MNVKKPLFSSAARRYADLASTKVGVGFDSPNHTADSRYFSLRLFYVCQYHSCVQIMVGRNGGALALAGFCVAGLSTLLRLASLFDSGVVRLKNFTTQEAIAMATTPTCTLPENLSLDCYRKLQRARETARYLFLDLRTRTPDELPQYYLPFIFSWLADDLNAIHHELTARGLFAAFQTQPGGGDGDK